MALKSPRDKYTSPNKNNESDSEDQKADTSQETIENRKKSKSYIKKNAKQKLGQKLIATTSAVATQTHIRVPTRTPTSVSLVPMMPTTVIPVTSVATYYPPYGNQSLGYPLTISDWNAVPAVPLQSPVYNLPFQPVPIVLSPQMLTPMCPYSGLMTQPILAPVVPQPVVIEEVPMSYGYDCISTFSPEQTVPTVVNYETPEAENVDATLYETVNYSYNSRDPLEGYLSLPRELFPKARMMALDPNPIIDEFCKIVNIHSHAPWILDLEFGVPRAPITRPIAVYDVKFNSVHCKNTPNAIHPGFEGCSQEFKNVFIFYYDCVISSWYRGYSVMNCDVSVENFQSWMHTPMQVFGMCWP